ncbi:hypothetical protein ACWOBH_10820 [Globicatella sanguinis]
MAGHKRDKFSQVMVRKLKAQWLSGLNLRLNEVRYQIEKFNPIIVR